MGRIFSDDQFGGVRSMAENLLKAAAPICEEREQRIEVFVPVKGTSPVRTAYIKEVHLKPPFASRIAWDHWTIPRHANRRRNVVVYNTKLVLPLGLKKPGVITLHDLMYFPQPGKYDWNEYQKLDSIYMQKMVPRSVKKASMVHTVSEYTKRDALNLFPDVDELKYKCIPHGIDAESFSPREWGREEYVLWEFLRARGVREPFVFHSGTLSRRKNVKVLAQAFAQFLKEYPDFQLVLTGSNQHVNEDQELSRSLNMIPPGKVVRLGSVSDYALKLLYQRASFFVFPSLYEGFGLPPLEAQASHCPVICSNATSLPEVVGNSALLFDPASVKDLLDKMRLMQRPETRDQYRQLGVENVRSRTWNKTAKEFLDLVDEVAARTPQV